MTPFHINELLSIHANFYSYRAFIEHSVLKAAFEARDGIRDAYINMYGDDPLNRDWRHTWLFIEMRATIVEASGHLHVKFEGLEDFEDVTYYMPVTADLATPEGREKIVAAWVEEYSAHAAGLKKQAEMLRAHRIEMLEQQLAELRGKTK